MATCIHSSQSCLLPFYTIPIFPLLNRKIFHLLVSFLFFAAHCILALTNILAGAIYCCFVFMLCCRKCFMYVCQLSLLQLLIWAGYRHFRERLPEAICCCLQTCNVYGTWVTLYCICVQIFMATCANIS